jgi:hypothetical protein
VPPQGDLADECVDSGTAAVIEGTNSLKLGSHFQNWHATSESRTIVILKVLAGTHLSFRTRNVQSDLIMI